MAEILTLYDNFPYILGTSLVSLGKHRSQRMMNTNGVLFVGGVEDALNHMEECPRYLTRELIDVGDVPQPVHEDCSHMGDIEATMVPATQF